MFYSGTMHKEYEMGTFIHDHSTELLAHTSHPYVDVNTIHDYIRSFAVEPQEQINAIFEKCKLVVRQPVAATTPAMLPLTKRSYKFGTETGLKAAVTSADLSQTVCLEAEPRLWRSISMQQSGRRSRALPAAILFDTDNEPCGYQKHNGNATAYFWRDATIPTTNGDRLVPGDAFVDLNYPLEADPRHDFSAMGLVALRRVLPTQGLNFMRFSTTNFSPDIRQEAFASVIAGQQNLAAHEHDTVTFAPEDVRDAVMGLLKDGLAHITGKRGY